MSRQNEARKNLTTEGTEETQLESLSKSGYCAEASCDDN